MKATVQVGQVFESERIRYGEIVQVKEQVTSTHDDYATLEVIAPEELAGERSMVYVLSFLKYGMGRIPIIGG